MLFCVGLLHFVCMRAPQTHAFIKCACIFWREVHFRRQLWQKYLDENFFLLTIISDTHMAFISTFICVDKMPCVAIKSATTAHNCQKLRLYFDEWCNFQRLLSPDLLIDSLPLLKILKETCIGFISMQFCITKSLLWVKSVKIASIWWGALLLSRGVYFMKMLSPKYLGNSLLHLQKLKLTCLSFFSMLFCADLMHGLAITNAKTVNTLSKGSTCIFGWCTLTGCWG